LTMVKATDFVTLPPPLPSLREGKMRERGVSQMNDLRLTRGRMKMNRIVVGLFIIVTCLAVSTCGVKTVPQIREKAGVSVIPKPERLDMRPGSFAITPDTKIILGTADAQSADVARYFAERIKKVSGIELQVLPSTSRPERNAIILTESTKPGYSAEGYGLEISPELVILKAAGPRGFFYGVQTLFQLLPPAVYSEGNVPDAANVVWSLPCLKIADSPRFAWRGMLLDVSRHFFSKEFVKEYIDFLAMHKMNTFHWHLTDDQGWRVEIKRYPRLTEIGAWRVDREDKHWNARERQQPGEKATLGGFYTQEDIKEIIAYAASRFVTIVPEIEMPGHCLSALASYPQYSCSGGPFTIPPGGYWPIKDVYCPGNEETFGFPALGRNAMIGVRVAAGR